MHSDESSDEDGDWMAVRGGRRFCFSRARAAAAERELNVRGLARALRSDPVNGLLLGGWEFAGVVRGGEPTPVFDELYVFQSALIEGNRWGDAVLLRARRRI